jgi:hypothetical protein
MLVDPELSKSLRFVFLSALYGVGAEFSFEGAGAGADADDLLKKENRDFWPLTGAGSAFGGMTRGKWVAFYSDRSVQKRLSSIQIRGSRRMIPFSGTERREYYEITKRGEGSLFLFFFLKV